jgi:hypothetical protein
MRWSLLLLTACEGVGVVHGNGVEGHERRSLGSFDAVHNEINADVIVTEGEPGAFLRCDENLVGRIQTDIRGSELHVDVKGAADIRPTMDCTVEVTAPTLVTLTGSGSGSVDADGVWPELREITASGSGQVTVAGGLESLSDIRVSGSGNVVADDIAAADLSARISGSGTLTLSGTTGFVDLDVSGSGDVAAQELTTVDADIHVSGSGNVELTATGSVDVSISGSGDVWLWGDPESVESDTSGSGEVHLED